MKNKILVTSLAVIIWIISIINLSGFGEAHNTQSKTSFILIFIGILFILNRLIKKPFVPIKELLIIFSISSVFILSSNFQGYRYDGIKYLTVFLLVYIVSNFEIDELQLKIISVVYGLLGLFILYVFNYRTVLSGWNPNSIAMIAIFSYLVYILSYIHKYSLNEKVPPIIVSIVYIYFMEITESRGSIFIIILSILIICNVIPIKKIYASNLGIILMLIIPLIVAVFVTNISINSDINTLNEWSMEKFEKPLFNGRDEIWIDGFNQLSKNILFGSGYINSGYWHNCAISCLTSYGVIGYTLWILALKTILCRGYKYFDDNLVIGCMTSFLLIIIQQSYELGLFSITMNLIPYFILGLLLGRIRELKGKYSYESVTS